MARPTKTDPKEQLAVSYREFGPRLARRIIAITGDPGSAGDLLNETFVRAHESLGAFEARSSLSTWLFGIAINVARAHVAKNRRRTRIDAALRPAAPVAEDLEVQVRQRDAVRRLYAALDQLDDDLRVAFVLIVLEGKSLKEASALLRVPLSTLHARRQRAEALVQRLLEEENA